MGFTPEERAKCRLVCTPIGNLSDMTQRALSALKEADIIFAEDTRTAAALLNHFAIRKPVKPYHKDNEPDAVKAVLRELASGRGIVLISEAGMPGISDPGGLLVCALLENNIPFEIVPGVNAAVLAAVASGLCKEGKFFFAGFIPHKGAEKTVQLFASIPYPIIFYESPHRVRESLKLLLKFFPPPVAVCRELTKIHEEIVYVSTTEDIDKLTVKGEFCLVVDNGGAGTQEDTGNINIKADALAGILAENSVSAKNIAYVLKKCGIKRNIAYLTAQFAVKNFLLHFR
ncbi:MAG: 16S rRNA (cytidine(1402)-2'-O)-methyltransferase [Deferribacteraceae bacterium]|jgi:16S rRNA (cytidine1402-2'-O)-methyltransferase|nr:16S rRNA (cytidine(1402)-2'-O)-methyltransferase [Deferribacteraceae bacterium]